MKKFFVFILSLTAGLLIFTAGFYSVYGLSKLFIGASMAVIIMAGTLEFSKIVIVSFLHQYWEKVNFLMKTYLIIAIVALMAITSAGIYGFLSSAYSQTSTELSQVHSIIESKQKNIEARNDTKAEISKQVETKRKRVIALTELREKQEVRVDSLYGRGWFQSARRTEKSIQESDKNIEKISAEIDTLNLKTQIENDSITKFENYITEIKNEKILGEVGPLKYVASITGKEIDDVVNWLILLFIFLIDPLAILFIISTSLLIKLIRSENELQKTEGNAIEGIIEEVVKETVVEKAIVEEIAVEKTLTKEVAKETIKDAKQNQDFIEYESNNVGEFEVKAAPIYHVKIDGNEIKEGVYTATTVNDRNIVQNKKLDDLTYVILLEEIYDNGKKQIDDMIVDYDEIKNTLQVKNIMFDKNIIKDFISIIHLLNIVKDDDKFKNSVIKKSFDEAMEIIRKV